MHSITVRLISTPFSWMDTKRPAARLFGTDFEGRQSVIQDIAARATLEDMKQLTD